jgi:hypothetical protein
MVVAAFGGRVMLCSLLANFSTVSAAAATVALQIPNHAEGRMMACRDHCGHWQVCCDAFVMDNPGIEFSLFVVFFVTKDHQ